MDSSAMRGAGVAIRFVALLIDGLIFMPVSFMLACFYGSASSLGFELSGPGFFVGMLLGFAYFALMEGKYGATLGKMAVGLRVVKKDGSPCDYSAAIVRTVFRLIDAFPVAYLTGAIFIWISDNNQRVGDLVAGTFVIKKI